MKDKMIIHTIISAFLLVISSMFLLIAKSSISKSENMKSYHFVLIILATVLFLGAMVSFFILIIRMLKDKKII